MIEGVGAGRQELAPFIDYSIWVDTDRQVAMNRGLAREGEDLAFWREWEVSEEVHLARDRPWERADVLFDNDNLKLGDESLLVRDQPTWSHAARPW